MFDQNGLELSDISRNTMNAYKYTSVILKLRSYKAFALSLPQNVHHYSMHTIGHYDDVRDAAFVAQSFAKKYSKQQVTDMVNNYTFNEVCKDFIENLEMPVWKFEAEGHSIDEILGENFGYSLNYASTARDALSEVFKAKNSKYPSLEIVKKLICEVENLRHNGMSYLSAAKKICEVY